MIIIFYDGSRMVCETIEFSMDGSNIIADEYRTIPTVEVLKIVSA